ncbi:alpha/beta hydrolase [Streptomyces sp. NPDC006334]|uniref:alpha/beta fold hydrolase n=1 Tax=Streptomyces sp. NPDC006334 TaxID=3156754 RepID=UPI0033B9E4E0
MTVVFVHGVPETPVVWQSLRRQVDGDSIALRLPGFGSPLPDAYRGKDDFAQWLTDELRAIPGPLDLVGHDWGAHLVLRAVTTTTLPIRSWVSDVMHAWHPDYTWHGIAQQLIADTGEEFLAALRPPAGSLGPLVAPLGVDTALAAQFDAAHDAGMGRAILSLYRSAPAGFAPDWGHDLPAAARIPGLVLIPQAHPLGDEPLAASAGKRAGAAIVRLPGLSHLWMAQDPETSARVLTDFWNTLEPWAPAP